MPLHPPWEHSGSTVHPAHGLFQGSPPRELGKKDSKETAGRSFIHGGIPPWLPHTCEHHGSGRGHSSAQRLQAEINYVPGAYKPGFVYFQDAL